MSDSKPHSDPGLLAESISPGGYMPTWTEAALLADAYNSLEEQYEGERTKNEKLSALIVEQEGLYRDEKRRMLEQLEALCEFYEAHWEVEQGVTDFDLHTKSVIRLTEAEERVRNLLYDGSIPAKRPT